MRVLVCGGRIYWDSAKVNRTLSRVQSKHDRMEIIHGACRTGADELADRWAVRHYVQIHEFPADWEAHGRAAGPIRNQRMIDEGKPDLVVAFPGGRGTADMVRRAKAAGIKVVEVPA